jgi:hypothetical protein
MNETIDSISNSFQHIFIQMTHSRMKTQWACTIKLFTKVISIIK